MDGISLENFDKNSVIYFGMRKDYFDKYSTYHLSFKVDISSTSQLYDPYFELDLKMISLKEYIKVVIYRYFQQTPNGDMILDPHHVLHLKYNLLYQNGKAYAVIPLSLERLLMGGKRFPDLVEFEFKINSISINNGGDKIPFVFFGVCSFHVIVISCVNIVMFSGAREEPSCQEFRM